MNEGFPKSDLSIEHLRPDIKPIMVCLENGKDAIENVPDLSEPIEFVDLYADMKEMQGRGFKKVGIHSYVISPVDSNSKFSIGYAECTGLVITGIDASSGKNISLMSHQNPDYFLKGDKEQFTIDLQERLKELRNKSENKTVDAVIFGGKYAKVREIKEGNPGRNWFIDEYVNSIKFLSQKIYEEFGFYPTVIVGPKTSPSEDHAAFNNENRRLYLSRTKAKGEAEFIQSFRANDIDEVKGSWKPGEWSIPV